MNSTEWMLIVSTFVVGMVAGGYFYLTAYKPSMEEQKQVFTELDWEIIAREVGSCEARDTCQQFYLASDRTYKYSPDGDKLEEGRVSRAVRRVLADALASHNHLEDQRSDGNCRYETDEVNYVYDIEAHGERYRETTCDQQFAASPLASTLAAVWPQLATGEYASSTPVILEQGVEGWLENYLDKQFNYDD